MPFTVPCETKNYGRGIPPTSQACTKQVKMRPSMPCTMNKMAKTNISIAVSDAHRPIGAVHGA